MPWGALISAGVGLYMGSKAKKAQNRGMEQQRAMFDEEMAFAREKLAWGKEKYGDWEEKFNPAFSRMMQELDQDLTPNYGMIAGDVKSSFQSARGQERRSLMRYGIRPNDGAFARSERDYGIGEAAAHVGARSQARESKRGLKFNRLQNVNTMLAGMQGIPARLVDSGFNAGQNALRGAGDMYSQQGQTRYDQGMAGASDIGQAIGGVDWTNIWDDVKGWFSGGGSSAPTGP